SGRRRHTRSDRDWSSDVCSSDLLTRTSLSPRVHDLKRNGPVPIGCWVEKVPVGWKMPSASTAPLSAWYFCNASGLAIANGVSVRSEEHTSELQSRSDLVCRLLLE